MEYRPIPSMPRFAINELGEVINIKTGRVRNTSVNAQGVLKITVWNDGRTTSRSVSTLVAEAWLTEPYPDVDNSIIHLDGDRLNCHVKNLARRPRWFAVRYHRQFTPRLELDRMNNHHYLLTETGEHFHSVRDAVTTFGILGVHLFINTLNGERVWPGGLKFIFVPD